MSVSRCCAYNLDNCGCNYSHPYLMALLIIQTSSNCRIHTLQILFRTLQNQKFVGYCTLQNDCTLHFDEAWIIKVCEMAYSIQGFRENPRFLRKSKISVKIRDSRENSRFLRKSEIFAKIRDSRENPRFSRKFWIFAKILDFHENSNFCKNLRFFFENLDGFQIHFTP